MSQIEQYHRPQNLADALALLTAPPPHHTAILAGGTHLNAHLPEGVTTLIDLQAVGLGTLSSTTKRITMGAMTRLDALIKYAKMPTLIGQTAYHEGPNTLRHVATIGGVIAGADWESELLAALLVYQAELTLHTLAGSRTVSLVEFLADAPTMLNQAIITEISLPLNGKTAHERVARTPADSPIVAAVARLDEAGSCHVALCGVAKTPILVNPNDLTTLNPPDDFRGSTDYRRAIAETLTRRVVAGVIST